MLLAAKLTLTMMMKLSQMKFYVIETKSASLKESGTDYYDYDYYYNDYNQGRKKA